MSLEWIFIEIFVIIVEVSAIFYLLCNKFVAKYNTFIPTILFIIGNIILIAFPMFTGLYHLPIAETIVPISWFLYLLFFRNGSVLKKIFWTLISFTLVAAIAIFSITLISSLSAVSSLDIMLQNSTVRLFNLVIGKVLQIVIFYILTKKKRKFEAKNTLAPVPMLVCCVVPFLSIILIFFIYILLINGMNIPEEILISFTIVFLVINITVFILYEIISRESQKNYILIAKHKQYELTGQHNKQVIEIYEKMREWKHDFISHMQLVSGMLEKFDSVNNSEAINYIKSLDQKIKSAYLEIITGNYIVDAIVSAKVALASAHSIRFEYNILLPENISIENTDLCSILSNLLDNAIEACCKLEHNRYINLEMLIFKNQFNIKITNSSNGEYKIENGSFRTTKSGDLHGIGMEHVKSIVENYGGILDIKPESDSFTTHISIPLARKSAN